MRQLGLANGVSRQCVSRALAGPYPKSERMIAAAIGLRPEGIWPSRYNADGTPNRSRGRQPMRPVNGKPSTPRGARNTHSSRAA
jgi:Ner family transcriptional regulator